MLEFLQNNWGSLLVGAIVLAVVALIVVKLVKDARAGRHICGGDCKSCGGHCSSCGGCCQMKNGK